MNLLSAPESWSLSSQQAVELLNSSQEKGLSLEEVAERRKRFGWNQIQTQDHPPWWVILARQFKGLLVALLVVAAIVAFVAGDELDALAILVVLLINALIGFLTEIKALKSMQALKQLGQTQCKVLRDQEIQWISSIELVPGDILILEAGDLMAADARLLTASRLQVDESTLTGESLPVEKEADLVLSITTPVFERKNRLMRGSHITRGVATAIVTEIGSQTELGQMAQLTSMAKEEITPLEKRLDQLGKNLVGLTLMISFIIFILGVISGKKMLLMLETAIALAVATVPEGLPIVATMALAKGLWTMAKKKALINRLSAVETLGAVNVLVTDKTGTLTENKMTVAHCLTEDHQWDLLDSTHVDSSPPLKNTSLETLLQVMGLCNDAQFTTDDKNIGDPMELALLKVFYDHCPSAKSFLKSHPRVHNHPFEAETKMMSTVHPQGASYFYAIKGAPESVLKACTQIQSSHNAIEPINQAKVSKWLHENQHWAQKGLRVLALAYKSDPLSQSPPYQDLIFLGLVTFIDPPRKEIPQVIEQFHKAGVRVVMATGDQSGTALKIAEDLKLQSQTPLVALTGEDFRHLKRKSSSTLLERLLQASVFSRVSPEQKLELVEQYQKSGAVVAMTGDGVNDAPALKKADIGIAMGLRGTQVAKEAADMVLQDDRFETILMAIQQGRVIFSNIRKFVVYLLSCNLSEVLVVAGASLFSQNLIITPLQILFLNLVTDVFPALALGMGKGDQSYLHRPPRESHESLLKQEHWIYIAFFGLWITAITLSVFFLSQNYFKWGLDKSITLAFLTLGLTQLIHVFNLRGHSTSWVQNDITQNPFVWMALVVCVILFLICLYTPFFRETLKLTSLSFKEWGVVIIASLTVLVGSLLRKWSS